ncbi:NAD(P)H-dependent glycerol-3-phosphate dehydrogenase [Ethanoligenens harbinense]|uniref:Glycerol-3-phosphate dehydrogenase [NAD(P)+] n=1 Tax=Ethanoligenens harbinense (strain DSM 18485 / JCM 12961 / CGMCC 1.5033 / YUAN-3) TaxID=663278 RepID=E6U501_ETHHY|nr:NAD(P)H-dependent glycerol-3-phosphate dehydrogenase [Ethanoligenens harbinense]ADU26707.1 NAD-dependent glycerol-3-phosphate dehydrogenase domain protein [Ethanoligenens harbinense YUAN-3]AVQ95821.1 NAD(P)-dependent glycerol-3-phosphate dehydrogenase [Ethanoligenens harbinense YUAN-3]AYF38482.1 NAD(P)-dependent glycerol-3-phosphate dehydrogenase [Ethanoligenens harbinense]AYF41228.1 NAD(P)-dependent glycerol-3-phosphate dehydrogenase [Ethanoligenens harbinense]QCN92061.1 NAD(P)-dependent g
MAKIAVYGAGGWGTALAIMLCKAGHAVTLWSAHASTLERLQRDGQNSRLLPGVSLPPELAYSDANDIVSGADFAILAVPSGAVRETARRLSGLVRENTIVVNVAKGFEEHTLKRPSEVIGEELPGIKVATLSGPSHAEEVSRGVPTTVVAASQWQDAALAVQDAFMNPMFRIYVNPDIVGVEIGGATKNVIALAAGICDGLRLGDNPKAALMTRGITEMARLGMRLGGRAPTFAGLAGIGDLIVTCSSEHSRNRRAGIYIGQGMAATEAVAKVGMTVEGYTAAHTVHLLAERHGVDMPIVTECYRVLYEQKDPYTAICDLMQRQKKHEFEDVWLRGSNW